MPQEEGQPFDKLRVSGYFLLVWEKLHAISP